MDFEKKIFRKIIEIWINKKIMRYVKLKREKVKIEEIKFRQSVECPECKAEIPNFRFTRHLAECINRNFGFSSRDHK